METEGPIVKRLDVINLQWTVSSIQTFGHFSAALEMVKHLTLAIMENNTPIFFGPDATCEGRILRVLEAAGNHHTGAGQGT